MNECFISVDIETTGPYPFPYSMYELGACVIGRENLNFHAQIALLPGCMIVKEAIDAVGITEKELREREGQEIVTLAMKRFEQWIISLKTFGKPVFVANNAPFDWMFVEWYFSQADITNPFGHSALDMKAYFMGLTGCSWKEASLRNMAAHVNILFVTLPHHALDDALIQSGIFAKLLERKRT